MYTVYIFVKSVTSYDVRNHSLWRQYTWILTEKFWTGGRAEAAQYQVRGLASAPTGRAAWWWKTVSFLGNGSVSVGWEVWSVLVVMFFHFTNMISGNFRCEQKTTNLEVVVEWLYGVILWILRYSESGILPKALFIKDLEAKPTGMSFWNLANAATA